MARRRGVVGGVKKKEKKEEPPKRGVVGGVQPRPQPKPGGENFWDFSESYTERDQRGALAPRPRPDNTAAERERIRQAREEAAAEERRQEAIQRRAEEQRQAAIDQAKEMARIQQERAAEEREEGRKALQQQRQQEAQSARQKKAAAPTPEGDDPWSQAARLIRGGGDEQGARRPNLLGSIWGGQQQEPAAPPTLESETPTEEEMRKYAWQEAWPNLGMAKRNVRDEPGAETPEEYMVRILYREPNASFQDKMRALEIQRNIRRQSATDILATPTDTGAPNIPPDTALSQSEMQEKIWGEINSQDWMRDAQEDFLRKNPPPLAGLEMPDVDKGAPPISATGTTGAQTVQPGVPSTAPRRPGVGGGGAGGFIGPEGPQFMFPDNPSFNGRGSAGVPDARAAQIDALFPYRMGRLLWEAWQKRNDPTIYQDTQPQLPAVRTPEQIAAGDALAQQPLKAWQNFTKEYTTTSAAALSQKLEEEALFAQSQIRKNMTPEERQAEQLANENRSPWGAFRAQFPDTADLITNGGDWLRVGFNHIFDKPTRFLATEPPINEQGDTIGSAIGAASTMAQEAGEQQGHADLPGWVKPIAAIGRGAGGAIAATLGALGFDPDMGTGEGMQDRMAMQRALNAQVASMPEGRLKDEATAALASNFSGTDNLEKMIDLITNRKEYAAEYEAAAAALLAQAQITQDPQKRQELMFQASVAGSEAITYKEMTANEIIQSNRDLVTELAVGFFLDLSNLVPSGTLMEGYRLWKAGRTFGKAADVASLKYIDKTEAAVAQALTRVGDPAALTMGVIPGRPVGEAIGKIPLVNVLSVTRGARVNKLVSQSVRLMSHLVSAFPGLTTNDAEIIVRAATRAPKTLVQGIPLERFTTPSVINTFQQEGMFRVGATVLGQKTIQDLYPAMRMASDELLTLVGLSDEAGVLNKTIFSNGLQDIVQDAGRRLYGIVDATSTTMREIPVGATKFTARPASKLENPTKMADAWVVDYYTKEDKLLGTSRAFLDKNAAKQLATDAGKMANANEHSLPVRVLSYPMDLTREIMNLTFLGGTGRNIIKNALNAAVGTTSNGYMSFTPVDELFNDIERIFGPMLGSYRTGVARSGTLGTATSESIPATAGLRKQIQRISRPLLKIPYGVTEVPVKMGPFKFSIPVGEQNWWTRNFHGALMNNWKKQFSSFIGDDIVRPLRDSGVPPDVVGRVQRYLYDYGLTHTRDEFFTEMRRVLAGGNIPPRMPIPDGLLNSRALGLAQEAYRLGTNPASTPEQIAEAERMLAAAFAQEQVRSAAILGQNFPPPGAGIGQRGDIAGDTADFMDALMNSAKKAGIPTDGIQAQANMFGKSQDTLFTQLVGEMKLAGISSDVAHNILGKTVQDLHQAGIDFRKAQWEINEAAKAEALRVKGNRVLVSQVWRKAHADIQAAGQRLVQRKQEIVTQARAYMNNPTDATVFDPAQFRNYLSTLSSRATPQRIAELQAGAAPRTFDEVLALGNVDTAQVDQAYKVAWEAFASASDPLKAFDDLAAAEEKARWIRNMTDVTVTQFRNQVYAPGAPSVSKKKVDAWTAKRWKEAAKAQEKVWLTAAEAIQPGAAARATNAKAAATGEATIRGVDGTVTTVPPAPTRATTATPPVRPAATTTTTTTTPPTRPAGTTTPPVAKVTPPVRPTPPAAPGRRAKPPKPATVKVATTETAAKDVPVVKKADSIAVTKTVSKKVTPEKRRPPKPKGTTATPPDDSFLPYGVVTNSEKHGPIIIEGYRVYGKDKAKEAHYIFYDEDAGKWRGVSKESVGAPIEMIEEGLPAADELADDIDEAFAQEVMAQIARLEERLAALGTDSPEAAQLADDIAVAKAELQVVTGEVVGESVVPPPATATTVVTPTESRAMFQVGDRVQTTKGVGTISAVKTNPQGESYFAVLIDGDTKPINLSAVNTGTRLSDGAISDAVPARKAKVKTAPQPVDDVVTVKTKVKIEQKPVPPAVKTLAEANKYAGPGGLDRLVNDLAKAFVLTSREKSYAKALLKARADVWATYNPGSSPEDYFGSVFGKVYGDKEPGNAGGGWGWVGQRSRIFGGPNEPLFDIGSNMGERVMIIDSLSTADGITDIAKNADASKNFEVLIHELGHIFTLELRELAKTNAGAKADYDTLTKWIGEQISGGGLVSPDVDELRTLNTEYLTMGFTRYLVTNEAPVPALRPLFARMKQWIQSIMESVSDIFVHYASDAIDRLSKDAVTNDWFLKVIDATHSDKGLFGQLPPDVVQAYRNLLATEGATQVKAVPIKVPPPTTTLTGKAKDDFDAWVLEQEAKKAKFVRDSEIRMKAISLGEDPDAAVAAADAAANANKLALEPPSEDVALGRTALPDGTKISFRIWDTKTRKLVGGTEGIITSSRLTEGNQTIYTVKTAEGELERVGIANVGYPEQGHRLLPSEIDLGRGYEVGTKMVSPKYGNVTIESVGMGPAESIYYKVLAKNGKEYTVQPTNISYVMEGGTTMQSPLRGNQLPFNAPSTARGATSVEGVTPIDEALDDQISAATPLENVVNGQPVTIRAYQGRGLASRERNQFGENNFLNGIGQYFTVDTEEAGFYGNVSEYLVDLNNPKVIDGGGIVPGFNQNMVMDMSGSTDWRVDPAADAVYARKWAADNNVDLAYLNKVIRSFMKRNKIDEMFNPTDGELLRLFYQSQGYDGLIIRRTQGQSPNEYFEPLVGIVVKWPSEERFGPQMYGDFDMGPDWESPVVGAQIWNQRTTAARANGGAEDAMQLGNGAGVTLDDLNRAQEQAISGMAQARQSASATPPSGIPPQAGLAVLNNAGAFNSKWDDMLARSAAAADDAAEFTMLEPGNVRNIDTVLRMFMPYHYFWSRSAKNWTQRALADPRILNAWHASAQQNEMANQRAQAEYGAGVMPARGEDRFETFGDYYSTNLGDILFPFNSYGANDFIDPEVATNPYERAWLIGKQWTPLGGLGMDMAVSAYLDANSPRAPGAASRMSEFGVSDIIPHVGLVALLHQIYTGQIPDTRITGDPYAYGVAGRDVATMPTTAAPKGMDPYEWETMKEWAIENLRMEQQDLEALAEMPEAEARKVMETAIKQSGVDKFWGTLLGMLLGPSFVRIPEEELNARQIQALRRKLGFSAENPYGSQAAIDELDRMSGGLHRALAMYSELYPSKTGDQPDDIDYGTPGQNAAKREKNAAREKIHETHNAQIDAIIAANINTMSAKEIKELTDPINDKRWALIEGLDEQFPSVVAGRPLTPDFYKNYRPEELQEAALEGVDKAADEEMKRYREEMSAHADAERWDAYWEMSDAQLEHETAFIAKLLSNPNELSKHVLGLPVSPILPDEIRDVAEQMAAQDNATTEMQKKLREKQLAERGAATEERLVIDAHWDAYNAAPKGTKDDYMRANPDFAAYYLAKYPDNGAWWLAEGGSGGSGAGGDWDAEWAEYKSQPKGMKDDYMRSHPEFAAYYLSRYPENGAWWENGSSGSGSGYSGSASSTEIDQWWAEYKALGEDYDAKRKYMEEHPEFAAYYKSRGFSAWWEDEEGEATSASYDYRAARRNRTDRPGLEGGTGGFGRQFRVPPGGFGGQFGPGGGAGGIGGGTGAGTGQTNPALDYYAQNRAQVNVQPYQPLGGAAMPQPQPYTMQAPYQIPGRGGEFSELQLPNFPDWDSYTRQITGNRK
jgi:hypothetical protein